MTHKCSLFLKVYDYEQTGHTAILCPTSKQVTMNKTYTRSEFYQDKDRTVFTVSSLISLQTSLKTRVMWPHLAFAVQRSTSSSGEVEALRKETLQS